MSNAKIKTISLTAYNKKYGDDLTAPMYVVNRTAPRGRIAFSCIGDLGTPVPIIIEPTFIPIDLTMSAKRANLIDNARFRRMLASGDLLLVDNESAEEVFRTSERARKEHERLMGSEFNSGATDVDLEDVTDTTTPDSVLVDVDFGNDFMNSLVFRSRDESEEEDNLCNEFLRRSDTLTAAQMQEMIPHVSDRKELTKLIMETMEDMA